MTLTIYSDDYDESDSVSDGMSGRIFLDPGKDDAERGTAFGKLLSDAMMHIVNSDVKIDEIVICYKDRKSGQMFKRFKINTTD
jgi:hypothetical protein